MIGPTAGVEVETDHDREGTRCLGCGGRVNLRLLPAAVVCASCVDDLGHDDLAARLPVETLTDGNLLATVVECPHCETERSVGEAYRRLAVAVCGPRVATPGETEAIMLTDCGACGGRVARLATATAVRSISDHALLSTEKRIDSDGTVSEVDR